MEVPNLTMTFEQVLPHLKEGAFIARESWPNQYVEIREISDDLTEMTMYAFVLTNAYGQMKIWNPSVDDILADDWRVVDAQ